MKNSRVLVVGGLVSFSLLSGACPGQPEDCDKNLTSTTISSGFSSTSGGVQVAVGDVTGDGVADLVTGFGFSEVSGLTLELSVGQSSPGTTRRTYVVPHVLDARIVDENGRTQVLSGSEAVAHDLAVGDLDGDGAAEIIVALTHPATGPVIFIQKGGAALLGGALPGGSVISAAVSSIVAGDLDGDGAEELVAVAAKPGTTSTNVHVASWGKGGDLGAQPTTRRTHIVPHVLEKNSSRAVVLAPTNYGDNTHGDVLVVTQDGVAVVSNPLHESSGTSGENPLFEGKNDEKLRSVAAGDVDGDGHMDVLAIDDRGMLHTFLAVYGERSYEEARLTEVGGKLKDITVGDLDGDGEPEALVIGEGASDVLGFELSVFGFTPEEVRSPSGSIYRGGMTTGAPKKSFASKLGGFAKGVAQVGLGVAIVPSTTTNAAGGHQTEVLELAVEKVCR